MTLVEIAIKLANTAEGWRPYYFERVHNGMLIKGCQTAEIKKGPRKGQLKYLTKENPLTIVVSSADLERLSSQEEK